MKRRASVIIASLFALSAFANDNSSNSNAGGTNQNGQSNIYGITGTGAQQSQTQSTSSAAQANNSASGGGGNSSLVGGSTRAFAFAPGTFPGSSVPLSFNHCVLSNSRALEGGWNLFGGSKAQQSLSMACVYLQLAVSARASCKHTLAGAYERIALEVLPFENAGEHDAIKTLDRTLPEDSGQCAPTVVEKRVEIPVEKIVEKRVEVPVEKIVEKPVTRVIYKGCAAGLVPDSSGVCKQPATSCENSCKAVKG